MLNGGVIRPSLGFHQASHVARDTIDSSRCRAYSPIRNKWRRPPSLLLHLVQVCRGYMLSSSARVGIRCGARTLFLFQSAFLEEHSRLDLVERMGRCAGI